MLFFSGCAAGKTFACYEWCMTDKYDPSNARHNAIKLGIEEGDGIPCLDTTAECLRALRAVGFEVIESCDMVTKGDHPWFRPAAQQEKKEKGRKKKKE